MGNTQKKAILIDVIDPQTSKEDAKKRLDELESLVNTYGGVVIVKSIQKKGVPDYENYVGKGKLSEILQIGEEKKADIVVVNNLLKPRQLYNINEFLRPAEIKAWDRVDLILKIFAKHAKSTEAMLQIELASIRHMGPRIFDMGIELSRQGGATGLRSGQGESNIEIMKRHLSRQEQSILKKLEHYNTIREGHRNRRKRQNFKTAALVGYTNAGKSSLLNALTGKGAYVANQLFATLDTRVGKLYIQGGEEIKDGNYVSGKEVLISDTIGFIQDLPPSLIQAFKSTLAETIDAEMILHVIDVSDTEVHKKIKVVEEILKQLEIDQKRKIYIFNKTDLVNKWELPGAEPMPMDRPEYPGVLKAGEDTSKILGWTANEEYEREFAKKNKNSPMELAKKYKEFHPVFVSAHEKNNLESLIKELEKL